MRIAVFGAGGRTGRHVVRIALERGHDVVGFVREPSETPPGIDAVAGDARDAATVERAVGGADAVISVLALMSADAEPEYSEATSTIVAVAASAGVRRIVITANNDVLTDREVTGEFAAHAREHRRNRSTVASSDLGWTILAAPWVTDDEPRGAYDAVLDERGPGKRTAPGDFALACVDALERDEWIGHIVGITST